MTKFYIKTILDLYSGEYEIIYESDDFTDVKNEYDRLNDINFAVDGFHIEIVNNETNEEYSGGVWYQK